MEAKTNNAIGQLISRSKISKGEINKPSEAFDAFNNALVEVFNYSSRYYNKVFNTSSEYYNREQYKAIIYESIKDLKPLPDDITYLISLYYKGSQIEDKTEIDREFMELLTYAILVDEKEKKERAAMIKKNETETAEVRDLINKAFTWDLYDTVLPLIKWAENHNRLDTLFFYELFTYGYILGKRMERAKRKGKYCE